MLVWLYDKTGPQVSESILPLTVCAWTSILICALHYWQVLCTLATSFVNSKHREETFFFSVALPMRILCTGINFYEERNFSLPVFANMLRARRR